MPFERARTLFVMGQIHRRRKEKRLARQAMTEALATFKPGLETPVWAERARTELARIPQRHGRHRPHPDRGDDRQTRDRGPDQPGDCRARLPEPEDRRGEPLTRIYRARRALGPPRAGSPPTGAAPNWLNVGDSLILRWAPASPIMPAHRAVNQLRRRALRAGVQEEDLRELTADLKPRWRSPAMAAGPLSGLAIVSSMTRSCWSCSDQ